MRSNNVILIILALVIVGAVGYFVLTREPATNEIVDTTTDEIANWSTYRNEELEFEFRYPATWQVRLLPPQQGEILKPGQFRISIEEYSPSENLPGAFVMLSGDPTAVSSIEELTTPGTDCLRQADGWIECPFGRSRFDAPTTINGQPAVAGIFQGEGGETRGTYILDLNNKRLLSFGQFTVYQTQGKLIVDEIAKTLISF